MLVFLSSLPAAASGVDLFTPSSSHLAGDGAIQAESGAVGGEGFVGGMVAAYTADPAVWLLESGEVEPAIVAQAPVTLVTGWTVPDVARVSLFLPTYAWVDAPIRGFAGGALGDLRLQANLPVWSAPDGLVSLALVPRVGLPTGSVDAAVARGPSAGLVAALSGEVRSFGWVANLDWLAAANRPLAEDGAALGSTTGGTAAAWWRASEGLRLGAELDGDFGLVEGVGGRNDVVTTHAFVQQLLASGVGLTAGAGAGLTDGIGSPRYRVFASFHFTGRDRDRDDDGVLDAADACVTEPEDLDGSGDADGCPDPDDDFDGILDGADLCATEAEDLDGFDDRDGCPEQDNDFDGVLDGNDACPAVAGPMLARGCPDTDHDLVGDADDACPREPGVPEERGCPARAVVIAPADADGDGVPDDRDRCPQEAGPLGEDPATADGCPKTLYVAGKEIKITERIDFELGKADLRPQSVRLVDAVAEVLLAETGVRKVEVQGHTDNVGGTAANLALSEARARAVVDRLVEKGVDRGRLVAKGYGEALPLFSNRTPQGREQNRRVQFLILDGAAGAPAPSGAPLLAEEALGGTGTLDVRLAGGHYATVSVDGRPLEEPAPMTGWSLPAGTHEIVVENARLELRHAVTVTVRPGETTTVVVPEPGETENPWSELR